MCKKRKRPRCPPWEGGGRRVVPIHTKKTSIETAQKQSYEKSYEKLGKSYDKLGKAKASSFPWLFVAQMGNLDF